MKFFLLIGVVSVALFGADLTWSNDYEVTKMKAKQSKKLVYVFVTSDDCRWCRKFEETTLQNKEIQKRLYGEFEVVHLSRDRHKIPAAFETSPVPRHYFTDEEGNIIYSSLGHRGEECFDSFMDNAKSKSKTTK